MRCISVKRNPLAGRQETAGFTIDSWVCQAMVLKKLMRFINTHSVSDLLA
jgi:hypothetical protein